MISEMKVTATCYPIGTEVKQEVASAIKKSVHLWLERKLEAVTLDQLMAQREALNGSQFRRILHEINNLLIDINAHLESGNRYYNALFERYETWQ